MNSKCVFIMKASLLPILLCFAAATSLHAGQSQLFNIVGPAQIQCCGPANYSIDVRNINPTFAIENISGRWVVTRNSDVIYEEDDYPRIDDLQPNTTTTFVMEIPEEFLLLDGLLEIFFEFNSDFDLNPDPTKTLFPEIIGCGMTILQAATFFISQYTETAHQQDAYIFLFQQLLKPGTIIHGSNGETYSTAIEALSWMAMIYNPLMRFEQPVTLVIADANTKEVEVIDANWPPIIFDEPYVPDLNTADQLTGESYIYQPSPVPFDYTPVSSIPMDSVCAILVEGIDQYKPNMQESFERDIQLMKGYLTNHPNGPRLSEANVLVRQVKNGYHGDSLLMDLLNLYNKYNKVYFYYTGHGSQTGELCTGTLNLDWVDYTRLANDLLGCGADRFCIMIDACYSGQLVDAICAHPNIGNLDVEVVASSNAVKTSRSEAFGNANMNDWYGKFTSQFFWTVQQSANDKNKDGKVSFVEGYKTIRMNNFAGIEELQSPLLKDVKHGTVKRLGNAVKKEAQLVFGPIPDSSVTISVFPSSQPPGAPVISFDLSTTYTFDSISYLGWIDWQPNALLPKPITYAFVNAQTDSVTFSDYNYTWPTLPLCPGYNPCDPESVFEAGIDYVTGQPFNQVHQQKPTPSPAHPNQVAIVVSGYHPDSIVQDVLDASANAFMIDLVNETYAEDFSEEDISFQPQITGTTLTTYLQSLENKEIVYFYYTGNMTQDGKLLMADNSDDGLYIDSLFTSLDAVDASEYKIFLDAGNAGLGFDILKAGNYFTGKKVDLFTSSNATLPSYFVIWVDDSMNMQGASTSFTYHLLQQYGNPAYNTDGNEKVSFKESFNELFIKNPVKNNGQPIFRLSQPLNMSFGSVSATPAAGGTVDFTGLDVKATFENRSLPFDITASQELYSRVQSTPSASVFEISPSRLWTLEGNWDVDTTLLTSLVFCYDESIDVMSASSGILGLVSRLSPGHDWEAHYPVVYDLAASTITARDVREPREWAIARVQEPVGSADQWNVITDLNIHPNPVIDYLTISFGLDQATTITMQIRDLNGRLINTVETASFSPGNHMRSIPSAGLTPGMYWMDLTDGERHCIRAFIVQ